MPQQPDQPPESIVLASFSGLKNTVAPERLTANELETALNVDIDDTGQLRRRRGYDLKIAGSFHSIRELGGKIYGVKDGALGIIRPDYTFFSLGVTVGLSPVCYAQVDDNVYFSSLDADGVILPDETIIDWGMTDGQGTWWSPVISPTATLGAVSGKLLGDPVRASVIEPYKGRIYLAHGKTLWATGLYMYHYVDRTKDFMQFEHEITLLMAMADGLYVGTVAGLYFIQGTMGGFKLQLINESAVLPGSGTWVPANLVHPQARNGAVPTGQAAVFMTSDGIIAGFDGGNCYNITQGQVEFPDGISAAGLFRQDQGVNSYVAAVDSAGGPSANARIGDYVDAEIRRAGG